MTTTIEAQRQDIIHRQAFPRNSWAGFWPIFYKEVQGKESLPCAIRAAMVSGAILNALTFQVYKDEWLIGRINMAPPPEPQEIANGTKYFESHPSGVYTPGQSGHAQVDFQQLFSLGIDGLRTAITAMGKSSFYTSCIMALTALSTMIEHAEQAADAAGNSQVADMCHNLRTQPPASFREAVQLIWFVNLAIEVGERTYLVVPGRLDRILIPFYTRDIMEHRLTRQDATEILAQLYMYMNALSPSGLAYSVMVGGDTVNDVSYIALEALRISRMSYPSVGICTNDTTPKALKALAVEIIAEGLPNPAFFNDRIIRRGLIHYGVPAADAGNYINSTCVEITPCGTSNVYVASPYFNLCACLLETMETAKATSFNGFVESFQKRLEKKIHAAARENTRLRQTRRKFYRRPLQSILTNDCLAQNKDIEEGGARYNWIECSFVGLANLIDSLYVIREEVFNRHAFTLKQLKELCDNDFAGNETLRMKFLKHYPKYGTANSDVDALVATTTAFIIDTCAKFKVEPRHAPFIPGTFCWIMHQRLGEETCATPDGRRTGFPFADGAGPAQGREKLGPTAAIMSVCSWDHSRLIGGSAFNMHYSKNLLSTQEAREKLLTLIDVFILNGGFETQINVTDADAFEKAMKEPDKYGDLIVRIGGYTDYFVRLSPQMQQEIIMRTRYANL